MPATLTVDPAGSPAEPHVLTVTGLAPGQVVTFTRSTADTAERVAGSFTADSGGLVSQPDYLYPFDAPVTYAVFDSTGTTLLATSAQVPPVPSGGTPWVRDVVFPMLRYAPVVIVDVTGRNRAGRVNPYHVVAQTYAVTTGDVRSGSTGSLQIACRSHAERDEVIYAMSTGNPCLLRVPAACRVVVDEMTFAPLDIAEVRWGTGGACVLTVDFIEVDPSEVATFTPISYATQTQNAAAAGLRYGQLSPVPSGLALAFLGHTYRDMTVSQTGVAP